MRITSSLTKSAYLSALKGRMGGHFLFGTERFTGFFLGALFSVTYHSGYEWNRRITNEKNSAIGYVRETPEGCEVRFVRTKGMLYPSGFLVMVLLIAIVFWAVALSYEESRPEVLLSCLALSVGLSLLIALVSAFQDSLTERSEEGARIVTACLLDPTDPFSYLNNQNRL